MPVQHPAFIYEASAGGIEAYRLEANGLQVLVAPQAAAPVVTVLVTYHVGSRNEGLGLTGATHFLEHMMFKGTPRFNQADGTSVFQTLQRLGARVNATTWLDRTNYYELLPREHLPLALEIEADRMRNLLLDAEEVARERTVILNELDRGQGEPTRMLYQHTWCTAFVAHPYHHPTIGWRSDVETVTAEGLRHFYDAYYWPDNATLSVIGDVGVARALELAAQHFGAIPAAPDPVPEVQVEEPRQVGERRFRLHQPVKAGQVMIAFKQPAGLDPSADALDVLAVALGRGKSSRLYRRLTDRGLTAHAHATGSRHRDPGLFYVLAALAPGQAHEAVEEAILEELQAVVAEGLTPDELARAKQHLKAQEAFGRDGPFAVASQLNEAIAVGDWRLYATYLDRIEAVTGAEVQEAAETYLHDRGRTVGYLIPDED